MLGRTELFAWWHRHPHQQMPPPDLPGPKCNQSRWGISHVFKCFHDEIAGRILLIEPGLRPEDVRANRLAIGNRLFCNRPAFLSSTESQAANSKDSNNRRMTGKIKRREPEDLDTFSMYFVPPSKTLSFYLLSDGSAR